MWEAGSSPTSSTARPGARGRVWTCSASFARSVEHHGRQYAVGGFPRCAGWRVEPLPEGTTEIIVRDGEAVARVPVSVAGIAAPPPVSFRRQIVPILSKAGCNSGGCHGKAEGQNGFKLSVFGFDPGHVPIQGCLPIKRMI